MPLLNFRPGERNSRETSFDLLAPAAVELTGARPARPGVPEGSRLRIFETCANPACGSGWLHLWRSRTVPVFEGGWNCSSACTAARVASAVEREFDARGSAQESHRHRIPLGLVMLEQGWITSRQLRQALQAQKVAGAGRLGHWLVCQQGVSEQLVTRALGLQWTCPVLPMEFHDAESLTVILPDSLWTPLARCPCGWPQASFYTWDLKTGSTR